MPPMRAALVIALATFAASVVHGQATADARLTAQLRQLFPQAAVFSARIGTPPHYEARASETRADGTPTPASLQGVAFWTTDLDPLERGYDGPIKILVGLDMRGTIVGIIVADHHEPYGYFSVDLPEFAGQFIGKSVRDPFRVGGDVDAVSRATLTVQSATRAIRNSSRRIAAALIRPPG